MEKPFKKLRQGEGWDQKHVKRAERILNLSKDAAVPDAQTVNIPIYWGFKVKTNVITILCRRDIKSSARA